jgi:hypothetical protein
MAVREFKNDVKAVVDYLAQSGIQVQHTVMLEAISKGFGERGWSAHREALAALAKAGDTDALQNEPASPPAWRYEDGPMSDSQYVARKGTRCPVCGSDHLNSESVEADGKDGWANVSCADCGATWSDSWQLTGYFDLDTPQAVEESTPEEEKLYADGEFVSIWDGGQFVSNARISLSNGVVDEIERVDVPEDLGRLVREVFRLANVPGAVFTLENVNGDYLVEPGAILTMRRLLNVERPQVAALSLRELYSCVAGSLVEEFEDGSKQESPHQCLLANGVLVTANAMTKDQSDSGARLVTRYFSPASASRSAVSARLNVERSPEAGKKPFDPYSENFRLDRSSGEKLLELVADGTLVVGAVELAALGARMQQLERLQQTLLTAVCNGPEWKLKMAQADYGEKEAQEYTNLYELYHRTVKSF